MKIVGITDIDLLMHWRMRVLAEVFGNKPDAELAASNRAYFDRAAAAGAMEMCVAETGGTAVACAAICYHDEMPSPDNPSGRCGHIMNVFTAPAMRRRGIAGTLVRHLVAKARERGCRHITLETTPGARALYGSLGFRQFDDMLVYKGAQ